MYYKIFRIGCSRVPQAFLCNPKPRVAEFMRYFSGINSSIIYLKKRPILIIWAVYNDKNTTDPSVVSPLMIQHS